MVGVSEYFRNQTVLITGGTGFLGQALIYKLLQIGCPKIFLLIRSKKGRTADERLMDMIKRYTFDGIRAQVDIASKLTVIPCDIEGISGLGISEEHQELIRNEVTVVLHGAASVKFDDPIKDATYTNLRMTRDILELTRGIKKLQLFTYVSTAYANCDHMMNGVEERLYDAKMDWRSLIEAVETLPDEVLNSFEGKLLGASPNTYIFTKHLTESLVNDYATDLPVLIIRPPIVTGGKKEPEPGWINNLHSPLAVIAASGKGVLRLFHGPPNSLKAYIAIDIVVNGTLAAVWHTATHHRNELVPVYNTNYYNWKSYLIDRACRKVEKILPFKDPLWYPNNYYITNRYAYLFLHLFVHVLPGLLLDGVLLVAGKKPILTRVYRKIYIAFILLRPFTFMSDLIYWNKFKETIMDSIPEDEKEIFYVDGIGQTNPKELEEYLKDGAIGFRALMGEPRKVLPSETVHYKRLYYLDLGLKYLFLLTIIWYIPYSIIFTYLSGLSIDFIISLN